MDKMNIVITIRDDAHDRVTKTNFLNSDGLFNFLDAHLAKAMQMLQLY